MDIKTIKDIIIIKGIEGGMLDAMFGYTVVNGVKFIHNKMVIWI